MSSLPQEGTPAYRQLVRDAELTVGLLDSLDSQAAKRSQALADLLALAHNSPRLLVDLCRYHVTDVAALLAQVGTVGAEATVASLRDGPIPSSVALIALLARHHVKGAYDALVDYQLNNDLPHCRIADGWLAEHTVYSNLADMWLIEMLDVESLPVVAFHAPASRDPSMATRRIWQLQGFPVNEWPCCPCCGGSIARRTTFAIQCSECGRCFTDADYKPVLSEKRRSRGRLVGDAPWFALVEGELPYIGIQKPWCGTFVDSGALGLA